MSQGNLDIFLASRTLRGQGWARLGSHPHKGLRRRWIFYRIAFFEILQFRQNATRGILHLRVRGMGGICYSSLPVD